MTIIGGTDFNPGEAFTFTYTFTPAINLVDEVSLEVFGLSIAGTVNSVTQATFTISKSVSAQLPAYGFLDARITVNEDDRVDVVEVQTGAAAGATAVSVTTASPISLSAGAGITLSPNPITGKGSISAIGAAGQGIPAGGTAGQMLVKSSAVDYAATWSTLDTNMVVCPEPGSSNKVTTNFRVYSVAQDAMANLVAETFYRAYGGTNSTGDVLLKTGVEAVYSYFGYTIRENGLKNSLPFDASSEATGVRVTANGNCYLQRGGQVDDAGDGYLVSLLHLETT